MNISLNRYRVNEEGMVLEYLNRLDRLLNILKTCAKRMWILRHLKALEENHAKQLNSFHSNLG